MERLPLIGSTSSAVGGAVSGAKVGVGDGVGVAVGVGDGVAGASWRVLLEVKRLPALPLPRSAAA